MIMSLEKAIERAKSREAFVHFELYRLLKNCIVQQPFYQGTKCKFIDVVPEFPVGKDRADIVVFVSRNESTLPELFLVIELKQRVYSRIGQSTVAALNRALDYSSHLSVAYPFVATYDGWTLLLARNVPPYILAASGAVSGESQCTNILMGLEEYAFTGKSAALSALPKHPDSKFLFKQVLPLVAKRFAKRAEDSEALLEKWKQVIL
jgi:hypothetical protein